MRSPYEELMSKEIKYFFHAQLNEHELILKKTKFVLNDRSGHDDQFCPKIVKIKAILVIFRPFEDFGNMPKINQNHSC